MEIQPDIVKTSSGSSAPAPAQADNAAVEASRSNVLWIAILQGVMGAFLCFASLMIIQSSTLLSAGGFLWGAAIIFLGVSLYRLKKWAWWVSVVMYSLSFAGNLIAIASGEKFSWLVIVPLALAAALVSQRKSFH